MSNLAYNRVFDEVLRKPPTSEGQYNWITGGVDILPEQMALPLPPLDDAVLPDDGRVSLLATENGSQLFVSGFGLFIGKKSERVIVRQGKSVCAQVPFMRLQEIILAGATAKFAKHVFHGNPRSPEHRFAHHDAGFFLNIVLPIHAVIVSRPHRSVDGIWHNVPNVLLAILELVKCHLILFYTAVKTARSL